MCGQSIAYNIYATLAHTNPLFMGFSCFQNGNKEMIILESVGKSESGKNRNRQNAEWISCKEKEKENSGKRKKDKREYSAMKKEDKRGRMGRDVDKKIPRKIVVQIEKIGDMHKNIHLLAWV